MRKLQVCVIGDSTIVESTYAFCEQLGKFLADNGIIAITGGRGGVMEAVNKGVYNNGGVAVSVLPGDQSDEANAYTTVAIPTGMGHTRNSLIVKSADIVIAIGGKAGTLSEISLAWIYEKKIIAAKDFGGWSAELADRKIDDRRPDQIIEVSGLDDMKQAIVDVANGLGWRL